MSGIETCSMAQGMSLSGFFFGFFAKCGGHGTRWQTWVLRTRCFLDPRLQAGLPKSEGAVPPISPQRTGSRFCPRCS